MSLGLLPHTVAHWLVREVHSACARATWWKSNPKPSPRLPRLHICSCAACAPCLGQLRPSTLAATPTAANSSATRLGQAGTGLAVNIHDGVGQPQPFKQPRPQGSLWAVVLPWWTRVSSAPPRMHNIGEWPVGIAVAPLLVPLLVPAGLANNQGATGQLRVLRSISTRQSRRRATLSLPRPTLPDCWPGADSSRAAPSVCKRASAHTTYKI